MNTGKINLFLQRRWDFTQVFFQEDKKKHSCEFQIWKTSGLGYFSLILNRIENRKEKLVSKMSLAIHSILVIWQYFQWSEKKKKKDKNDLTDFCWEQGLPSDQLVLQSSLG